MNKIIGIWIIFLMWMTSVFLILDYSVFLKWWLIPIQAVLYSVVLITYISS